MVLPLLSPIFWGPWAGAVESSRSHGLLTPWLGWEEGWGGSSGRLPWEEGRGGEGRGVALCGGGWWGRERPGKLAQLLGLSWEQAEAAAAVERFQRRVQRLWGYSAGSCCLEFKAKGGREEDFLYSFWNKYQSFRVLGSFRADTVPGVAVVISEPASYFHLRSFLEYWSCQSLNYVCLFAFL